MSREIIFRGKTKSGEWVHGLPFHGNKIVTVRTDNKSPYVEKGSANYYYDYHGIKPETLGQYTGLKDKNVKEIYEGDVFFINEMQLGKNVKVIGVIGYFEDRFICNWFTPTIFNDSLRVRNNVIEVIGNIHENPGLLK